MKKEGFRGKVNHHTSWELFWKMITFTLIGLAVFIYSLVSILNNKSSLLLIIGIISGILIFIYGIFATKRHYKNIR